MMSLATLQSAFWNIRPLQSVRRERIWAVCRGLYYLMKYDNERVKNRNIAKIDVQLIQLVKFVER